MRLYYPGLSSGSPRRFLLEGRSLGPANTHEVPGHTGYIFSAQKAIGYYGDVVLIIKDGVVVDRYKLGEQECCFELDPTKPLDPIRRLLQERVQIGKRKQTPLIIDDGPECVCQHARPFSEILSNAPEPDLHEGDGWVIGYFVSQRSGGARIPTFILVGQQADTASLLVALSDYNGITVLPA